MSTDNWPDDLRISGFHNTWPIVAGEACKKTSPDRHYCTLVKNHHGDHLTLLARWPQSELEPRPNPIVSKKWEYYRRRWDEWAQPDQADIHIKGLGEAGWELVTITSMPMSSTDKWHRWAYFKREIPADSHE
jgi:hypothetical protein